MSGRGNKALGMAVVIAAAIIWGSTGVAGEYLLNARGFDPAWLTTYRTTLGGALMLLLLAQWKGKALFDLWRDWRDAARMVAFGIVGVAANLYLYMLSVQTTNAPTATTLQYLSPALTVLWLAIRHKKPPRPRELLAVAFALVGVVLVATKGDVGSLAISLPGLGIGLLSAAALAFYGIFPKRLLSVYGPLVAYAWAQLVAGICMNVLVCPIWEVSLPTDGIVDAPLVLVLVWQLVFGTMVSYGAYLVGVDMIGPSMASMLSSIEPGATAVLSSALLSTPLVVADYAGIACMTACVVALSLP